MAQLDRLIKTHAIEKALVDLLLPLRSEALLDIAITWEGMEASPKKRGVSFFGSLSCGAACCWSCSTTSSLCGSLRLF